jgi:hypothetical protein
VVFQNVRVALPYSYSEKARTDYQSKIWPLNQLKYNEHFALASNTQDGEIAWGAFVSLTLLKIENHLIFRW